MIFFWERIDYREREQIRTWRAKVPGGWALRTESWWGGAQVEEEDDSNFSQSESTVFIPDPEHKWTIEK